MDLATISRRLNNRYYRSGKECLEDFNTVFSNCYTFNEPGDDVFIMAQTLENLFRTKVSSYARLSDSSIEILQIVNLVLKSSQVVHSHVKLDLFCIRYIHNCCSMCCTLSLHNLFFFFLSAYIQIIFDTTYNYYNLHKT